MFARFHNCKGKLFFRLAYLLGFSLLLTSCETVSLQKVSPDSLISSSEKIEDATHLILKDGTFVPLKEKDVYYTSKHKDGNNLLIVRNKEGYPVRDTVKNVTLIKYYEKTYPITDVEELFVEKRETDTKASITTGITIVLGAGLLYLLGALAYFLLYFHM